MNPDSTEIGLAIPAKAEYISLCRLALAGVSLARPLPEEILADLKLALTEACSNSVRHAYEPADGGVVDVRFTLSPGTVAIEVIDDGRGLEAHSGPDAVEEGQLDESGLGLAIIEAVTDEMEIHDRELGRGSRLRFVKHVGG